MRKATQENIRSGKTLTGCGDEIATLEVMERLVKELIQTLRLTALSIDDEYLPDSVKKHFDSLQYVVTENDGVWEFSIYFSDDLSRDSLYTDYNQGDGIDNIVALFNNGYVASSYKYGWWDNHKPTGEWSLYTSGYNAQDAYIRSRQARPSLHFMQRAIHDFMSLYGCRYNIAVELDQYSYDGNYMGSLTGTVFEMNN